MNKEFKIVKKRKGYTDIRCPDGSVVTYPYPPLTAMKYAKEDCIQAKHDYGIRDEVPVLTAHVSPDIAAWLDPAGGLQKAGLMKVNLDPQDAPGSDLTFRHKLILARDDNALAAHQDVGNEPKIDPEKALREQWTKDGVPQSRQDAIIAEVTAKAQPGAMVGPFIIGESNKDMEKRRNIMLKTWKPRETLALGNLEQGVMAI